MIIFHLDKTKYKDNWPPEGTLHAEGRWNKPRQWIIYCSSTISLAKLEILANENNLPINRVCMTVEVPDNTEVFEVTLQELPDNWMTKPYPKKLIAFTDRFLESNKYLLMKVPSTQSPSEFNYLVNVRHKDFHQKVKLLSVIEEIFDYRLGS